VCELFTDIKKACDSFRREVVYSILIEFGIPMKPFGLIKTYLNEIYNKSIWVIGFMYRIV
jgi:small basic protein